MNVIFKYYGVNIKGEKIKGQFDVETIDELSILLKNKGYFLYDFQIKRKSLKELFYRKPNFQDLSILCSTLCTMLSVGIPISRVLNILMETFNSRLIKRSLYEIKRSVSKGESIYESMRKFSHIYPLFLVEMIKVGEEGGKLDSVLKRMSEYYEKQHKIHMKIKTALIYPLLVFVTSIFIVIFLVMKIVPEFIDILTSIGGEIPFITKVLLYACTFLKTHLFIIGTVFIFFISLGFNFSKTVNGKAHLDKIKMGIPYFNKFYNKFIISRFATAMGILMSSGFSVVKALEITSGVLENEIMKNKIYNSIEDIKKGETIYNSFKNQDIGNNLFLSLVIII